MELDVTLLVLAIAMAAAFGLCLPDALFLTGLARIRRGVLGGPERVTGGPGAVVSPRIADELAELGFVPAGLYWEQMPAHKAFYETIFVCPAEHCYATVYRLFNNDVPRVAFKTAFEDGAYVLTQNYLGGMEAREETLWAGGIAEVPLEDVLAEHRRRVQSFVLSGRRATPALTVEDYVEAEWGYMEHPRIRAEHRDTVKTLFGLKVAFLAGGAWLAAHLGAGPVGIAAVLLAQSVLMLLVRYYGAILERILPAEEAG